MPVFARSRLKLPSLALSAAMLCAAWSVVAMAGEYPEKPVKLMIPYTAGGTADAFFRPLASTAEKYLGQPILLENRPGANGTLGVTAMVQAKPDGYTIAQVPITVFTNAQTGAIPFDPRKDITYIIHLTAYTFGLAVRADAPWKTVGDFVAHARARPDTVTFGTSGNASPGHLAMAQLSDLAKVQLVHVPFKGAADAVTALLGGHVQALALSSAWAPHVESGKMRLLATFGPQRTKRWTSVPTMKEAGYDIVVTSPYGLGGPRGMSPQVVEKLHSAFKRALEDPAMRDAMSRLDQTVEYKGPKDYALFAEQLYAEQAALMKRLKLQPN